MKKTIITFLALTFCSASFAAIVKSKDDINNCTLFQVIQPDENGNIQTAENQSVVFSNDTYGMSFQDMEINFEKREVLVQPMVNIILGLNKQLIGSKAIISAKNDQFNFLINQLNRKILVFEKICIAKNNEIIYANYFDDQENIKK